jgi:hypothetical protein
MGHPSLESESSIGRKALTLGNASVAIGLADRWI